MQISQLDYSSYLRCNWCWPYYCVVLYKPNQQVTVQGSNGKIHNGKVGKVFGYLGLERHES